MENETKSSTKREKPVCGRCHGTGIYYHFGTCYRCNGEGRAWDAPKREWKGTPAAFSLTCTIASGEVFGVDAGTEEAMIRAFERCAARPSNGWIAVTLTNNSTKEIARVWNR
jgi:hypothetical protein